DDGVTTGFPLVLLAELAFIADRREASCSAPAASPGRAAAVAPPGEAAEGITARTETPPQTGRQTVPTAALPAEKQSLERYEAIELKAARRQAYSAAVRWT